MHRYTKCGVSTSNPVSGAVFKKSTTPMTQDTNNDGQSYGSLVDKPNEPKTQTYKLE